MRSLSKEQREALIGDYTSPVDFYELVKNSPFLGSVTCSESELIAGSWHELRLTYTVGGSGLADGAWIKATFKFYSDWALFQTSDPTKANYVSAEHEAASLLPGQTASTVQALSVRFDQKGHERPFQKSIIVDVVDGFLNVGDKIHLRLGDRRMGGAGTRVQTFVEKDFRFRFYVDPVGTSRFAAVPNDIKLQIVSGRPVKLVLTTPRLVQPGERIKAILRAEDAWGNTVTERSISVSLSIINVPSGDVVHQRDVRLPDSGWSTVTELLTFDREGDFKIEAVMLGEAAGIASGLSLLTVDSSCPHVYYADLHVHSDDTVGTNDSLYNFSYAKECAGLDVVGYTANDFNITESSWDATVTLIDHMNSDGEFVIYPGTEWCGNTAVGGDHNVVFLDDEHREFPLDRSRNVARSFEWNDQMASDTIEPGTWPIDELYATYAHSPESHLLIPHIGGRRANLGWHHPMLERLIEVSSAWGHFEWFLRDAIARGYKLGVSANSDEHRGRCGGGVPGTAVFGTRGGLTGVIADKLTRPSIASALRSRHTFATTGQRLVGLTWLIDRPEIRQGDDARSEGRNIPVRVGYRFLGQIAGFERIEAFGHSGHLLQRDLHQEQGYSDTHVRVSWGGARIQDRYRDATWRGTISLTNGILTGVRRMTEDDTSPEASHWTATDGTLHFHSLTSGNTDGLILDIAWLGDNIGEIRVQGTIEGYVKIGDPLKPPPFKHAPIFQLVASRADLFGHNSSCRRDLGGIDMFVAIDRVARPGTLPVDVSGVVEVPFGNGPHGHAPVWFVARQSDGAKVWTSAMFLEF